MPPGRPATDYTALKPEIVQRYRSGQNVPEIALEMEGVTLRTLQRNMGKWGLTRRAPKINVEDPELRTRVAIYFIGNLSDDEMVFALQQQGWKCTLRQVARIRKGQGLVRRFSAFQRQVAVEALWDIIQQELDNGSIEGYGRRLLQVHFKRLGHQLSR
jgi:hypothetical protein